MIDALADPFPFFGNWLEQARRSEPADAEAMSLATVDPDGMPSSRMVLLKNFDTRGFVFYTNLGSRKAQDLAANPCAALLFHWRSLQRQVRIQGKVQPVTAEEADAYFAERPRASRIGAWASRQSEPLPGRWALETRVAKLGARFGLGEVPRPPFWSGFRLVPVSFEFWQAGGFRLHERVRYEVGPYGWEGTPLFP
ncbi:pyridoxamine 5'-phosphate oxidase [Niveibacterium sp. SC-1]|uniref:pyridoxamine 5'-phosphate oxidase n=1 Tax=Niveibacterium sp. SC-1 TaxID=3135646 RepID=UPI00311DA6A2